MKRAALLVLVACSDSSNDEPCPTVLVSDIVQLQGPVHSGSSLVAIAWGTRHGPNLPQPHGATILPDGTLTPDIRLAEPAMSAALGKSTVLWHPFIEVKQALVFILQRGSETLHIELATDVREHQVVFDGTRYQVFWGDLGGGVFHRSIDEDGTLGPKHTLRLGPLPAPFSSIAAATDGAGRTFLRLFENGYLVDTATGALGQARFSGVFDGAYDEAFFFNGTFHIVERVGTHGKIITLAAGGPMVRDIPATGEAATGFFATPTTLYVQAYGEIVELDTTFAERYRYTMPRAAAGMLGDDVIYVERHELDPESLEPGRLVVVRKHRETEVWRKELASDSFVHPAEICEQPEQ